jgi:cytoskeletal protein RodZ
MLAAAVVVTLLGVFALLLIFGQRVNDEFDKRATKVENEFNDIRREIDQRLPPPGAVPTTTAFPAPTATATAAPTETATTTPTPSPTATPTSTATATSTPTNGPGQP